MVRYLSEVHQTLGELIRLHQLNQELLETLSETMQWIRSYAETHSIQMPNSLAFDSLMNKADALIEEIATDTPMFMKPYDDSYHDDSNRRFFTGNKNRRRLDRTLQASCLRTDRCFWSLLFFPLTRLNSSCQRVSIFK